MKKKAILIWLGLLSVPLLGVAAVFGMDQFKYAECRKIETPLSVGERLQDKFYQGLGFRPEGERQKATLSASESIKMAETLEKEVIPKLVKVRLLDPILKDINLDFIKTYHRASTLYRQWAEVQSVDKLLRMQSKGIGTNSFAPYSYSMYCQTSTIEYWWMSYQMQKNLEYKKKMEQQGTSDNSL